MVADSQLAEVPWWDENGGFFGDLYKEADDSSRTFFGSDSQLNERTRIETDGVERLCGLSGAARILDCPCGYGRHSIELALRGHDVVGVDVNGRFLQLAEERAARLGTTVDLRRCDMRELPDLADLDAVINMFYSFGFFQRRSDDLAVLRGFHRALRPGGRFLMHTMITLSAFESGRIPTHEERRLSSGRTLVARRRLNDETQREEGVWSIIGHRGEVTQLRPYSVRIYSADEFSDLCLEAGFTDVDLFGDWDGNSYDDSSRFLIAVATK